MVGCDGGASPFAYVPANGKVTYDDGSPLPKGGLRLQFLSLDQSNVAELHPRPALATIDEKGLFENVTSYKYGDGLVRGKHTVAILDAKDEASGKLLVPEEYTSVKTSPIVVNTEELPFEIKIPKP